MESRIFKNHSTRCRSNVLSGIFQTHDFAFCHSNILNVYVKTNQIIARINSTKLLNDFSMSFCDKQQYFCFMCGLYTAKKNKRSKSEKFKLLFRSYYEIEWIDEDYVPQFGCSKCYTSLCRWSENKSDQANELAFKPKYKEPMTWMNPGEHDANECYFCVNLVNGINSSKKDKIQYIATTNTLLPVEHNKISPPLNAFENPEQQPNDELFMDIDLQDMPSTIEQRSTSSEYVPPRSVHTNPILVNQSYLNHMSRKLELSQRKSATLATLLKNNNLLDADVTISSQKNRQAEFKPFFETENSFSFCSNIHGLMEALHIDYDVNDWRLFIDASKSGLKAVLLHNDNVYMPVPVGYSRVLKETYASMKLIFDKINYNEHNWDVSGDLKVVALIMGLQLGRTRNSCFICTWISTAKIDHYNATWEKRSSYEIGAMNVKENSLVSPEKILLPTLHIKLGLIASFVRKLNKEEEAFKYLKVLFPRKTIAKIKAGECV